MTTRRLIIRPAAYADLANAHDWYEARRLNLGADLAECVLTAMREIQERATSFPVVLEPDIRRAIVDIFPYCVYFRTADHAVLVLAVLHSAQDAEAHLRLRH